MTAILARLKALTVPQLLAGLGAALTAANAAWRLVPDRDLSEWLTVAGVLLVWLLPSPVEKKP